MDKVCVLGLGYIGLPTALLFATHDSKVVGVDINPNVIKSLKKGKPHFEEKGLPELLKEALDKKTFEASIEVEEADAFIICVQTPLDKEYHVADLEYVVKGCEMVVPFLRKGNMVIIESTISPGSTANLFRITLEKSGLKAGKDFYLIHTPERAIPGNTIYEMINNHRIIGGLTKEGTDKARILYEKFVPKDKIHCTDAKTAEIVKLMENTFRDLNIALANEFAIMSEELGIDVWEAIQYANLHPRVDILRPGPGVGGHCIAIDPWFLVETSLNAQLIQMARSINDSMPFYTLRLTKQILGNEIEFPLITILGVAYKGNVDDTRETPALKYIHLAEKYGMKIKIHDPLCKKFEGGELLPLEEAVKDSDCIVVITDHKEFKELDPVKIAKLVKQKNVLDARNILDHDKWKKAGFKIKILGNNK
ncbi:MAG: nucleotide sugar dehydrogenase [Candidatus Heimdallarchaeota archaeon]|nr:nucleotide sugar dehydrogenase [Candidatus Heimdallarchaeota archaeon]